jgi:hypothetical protein
MDLGTIENGPLLDQAMVAQLLGTSPRCNMQYRRRCK